jgi:hypothetical protein
MCECGDLHARRVEVTYAELVAAQMAAAPHVLMRPRVFIDGASWCALYGSNIQEGVVGFGGSPEIACRNFDRAWRSRLASTAPEGGHRG